MMNSPKIKFALHTRVYRKYEQGITLFIAMIAIVILALAAVALIRSVDTSSLIAGNLSFKQSATASADAGIEAAITRLTQVSTANEATNVLIDNTHPFNVTNLAASPGYFSSFDPALNVTDDATWNDTNSVLVGTDSSGNTVRYIIQRMCRTPNVAIRDAGCMFSTAIQDKNAQNVPLPQDICFGVGCPVAGQTPMLRITARATGPKNTSSFVQAFVY